MANIPDDVLLNIFILLPAKILAQMRCVSKLWNALLSQPCFIKSHLHHSVKNNKEILLEFNYGFDFSYGIPCIAKYSRPPNRELPNFIEFPVDRPPLSKCFVIIGSVNGLICFINGDFFRCPTPGVYIWNPSLSALLHLPPYSVGSLCDAVHFRFGYVPKTDDYRVVKIEKLGESGSKDGLQVEVYSTKSGSWKLITERILSHVRICSGDVLCQDGQDGHVHWLGVNSMTKQSMIVAFDLHEESFCEIPVPDRILNTKREFHHNTLGMWNGKLCVMSLDISGTVEVWLMKEYKVAQSWVNPYIFKKCISDTKFAIRFKVNNESRFEAYRNHLAMYDPVAKSYKYMTRLIRPYTSIIVRYADSLVWVGPSKSGSTLASRNTNSKLKRKIDVIDD